MSGLCDDAARLAMDETMLDYLKQLRARYMQFWPLTDLLEKMMADIAQIQSDVAALKDAEAAAADELEQLANIVQEMAAAGPAAVTQEQLDELHDNLQSVTTALTAATQAAIASEPPHPEQT